MAARDSVAILGSLIGLVSLSLGWLSLRPNRIAPGASLTLWESVHWLGAAVILALWLACLVLSIAGKGTRRAELLGVAANLVLIISFVLTGMAASKLLESSAPSTRVSLGAGFWTTTVGAYIVILAARQRLHSAHLLRHLVSWTGLAAILALLLTGQLNDLSIMQEFLGRRHRFTQELVHHIALVGASVAIGAALGILLGVWATRSRRAERPIFYIANISQTIPSLALFGFLIAPLSALSFAVPALRELGIRGIGNTPAIIALVIYSLLPIVRNTYAGLRQIDRAVIDAGLGMGMSRLQLFRRIEAPLAAPLVLEGMRTAAVQSVGLAAVAALIGAGGLGWFIFQGLGQAASDLILLGAIPTIMLALIVDGTMRNVVRLATPRGLQRARQ